MTSTPKVDLKGLKELALKATPGPWAQGADLERVMRYGDPPPLHRNGHGITVARCATPGDVMFIAAANPQTILALLSLLETDRKDFERVIERGNNGELGTSKVDDMRHIARAALSRHDDLRGEG